MEQPGHHEIVNLPGRGSVVVHEWSGPSGAPVLVLIHGVALDVEINWAAVAPALADRFRVLALDLRGHGRGLPVTGTFNLEDCADDIAAALRVLGTGPVIPVGFSIGGMVAQLLWRRHRDLVAGLVLCSTARNVTGSPWERMLAMAMPWAVLTATWLSPFSGVGTDAIAGPMLDARLAPAQRRAALAHMRRMPLATAMDAMRAACAFSSHLWIGSVDVPTAVLVTRGDRIVAPRRQHKLAAAVPGAAVVEIDGDHGVFLADPEGFRGGLLRACAAVTLPVASSSTAA
ncbi:MAG: alpha/beta fold hydrolase [Pseudonocardiales bacterium]|nr:alpha/beta fold hydrolase [Pseudonocardiales bacterium]